MNPLQLVKMANQIGLYFDAMPDRAEALDGVTMHLRRFWEPRMRRALYTHIDAAGVEGLEPIVAEAVLKNRALLAP